MAAGRNFEIRLAATGGDQAAAELRKVERSGDRAKSGMQSLRTEGDKVTAGAVSMRMGIQNVAFQIQDMAVQAEMGVPAMRILAQQMPQLLGGFGMWGAVAGGVIALGAPLAAALMGPGEASKKSKESVKDLTDVLSDYKEAAENAARRENVDQLEAWFDALDDEEEKIRRNNDAMEAAIELQTKLTALKRGVEAAERDLAIANIEADPSLSDAEKTRQIAAYREKDERRKAESRIDELNNQAAAAGRGYEAAQGEADRKAADADAARRRREQLEQEAAANEAAVQAAKVAEEKAKELEGELQAAKDARSLARTRAKDENFGTGRLSETKEKEFSERIAGIEASLATERSKILDPEERSRMQQTGEAEQAKAREEEKRVSEEAAKAREDAEKAYAEMIRKRAAAATMAPLIEGEYRAKASARMVRAETTATEQEKRDAERRQQEQEREQRELERLANQEQTERRRAGAGAIGVSELAKDAAQAADELGNTRAAKMLKERADAVMQNPNSGGADQLVSLMERFLNWAEQNGGGDEPKIERLERRLQTLEARQKNARTGR